MVSNLERKSMRPGMFIANRRLILIGAVLAVAALCTPATAVSLPADPPPTIAQIVENAQAVFVGRVSKVRWTAIRSDVPGAGTISLQVKVTKVLLGDKREIPHHVIYVAGTASMTEEQAKARYGGQSFVFAGIVNRPRGGEIEIVIPPSGDPPFALSTLPEFRREIARIKGTAGAKDKRPGFR
jgi:hypothetical protein